MAPLKPLKTTWRAFAIMALIGLAVGSVIGYLAYMLTTLTGISLFLATGSLGGLAGVLAIQFYVQRLRLSEIKITVPQFSEMTFVMNNEGRLVAWQIFVEVVTRTSSQPLDADQGSLREAMTSLYELFKTVRGILRSTQPSSSQESSRSVEYLAISMLNKEIRPFLTRWHPSLLEFERETPRKPEALWPANGSCREELRNLQANLREYVLGFAALAGVKDAERVLPKAEG